MNACPLDCLGRQALKVGVFVLLCIGGLYLYGDRMYASAGDIDDLKADVKEQRAEIREELKAINQKLDAMRGLSSRTVKPNGP